MVDTYVDWLADHFFHLQGMSLAIVVDCGNGAAGTVLPTLIKKMKWKNVQLLYSEVDGTYPNHEANPVVESNMADVKKIIMTTDVQFGMGLDGDCDRMAAMTEDGYLIPGDQLLSLFAQQLLEKNPKATVVFDVKSSAGLIEILEQWGAHPVMSPSGHSIIKENMEKHQALLAGELSCHFFFKDSYFGYDDGIYAMIRLMEIVVQKDLLLSDLVSIFPKKVSSPEYRITCLPEDRDGMVDDVKKTFSLRKDISMITIDGVRATMPYGWGIIRPSNTQPKICLRFEADTSKNLSLIKKDFFEAIKHRFDSKVLKKEIEL
jgi:phosphomannomutase